MPVKDGEKQEVSNDFLLGKNLSLSQPLEGHRFGIDAVLLAATVDLQKGESLLDVGCGVGAALFCVGWRQPHAILKGLEREALLVKLAHENAKKNKLDQQTELFQGDVFDKTLSLVPQSFDHVISNPPFIEAGQTRSMCLLKARAYHTEENKTLQDWLRACLKYLKPRGKLSVIHRADRLDHLLQGVKGRLGDIKILPIASKSGQVAKRVIISGRKGVGNPCTLLAPFLVHEDNGGYTLQATSILREGEKLVL